MNISFESVNTEFLNLLYEDKELIPKTNVVKYKICQYKKIAASVSEDAEKTKL